MWVQVGGDGGGGLAVVAAGLGVGAADVSFPADGWPPSLGLTAPRLLFHSDTLLCLPHCNF